MRKIAVFGVSGRMGQMLVQATDAQPGAVSAAVERAGHDWIGQDLGQAMGGSPRGLVVTDDIDAALAASDVIIDFTAPDATVALAARAARPGWAMSSAPPGSTTTTLPRLRVSGKPATSCALAT